MLVLYYILICRSELFTMVIENDGIPQLSVFDSTSLKMSPYADIHIRELLPYCIHKDNTLYMTNLGHNSDTFFNQIDMHTGKILNSTALWISELTLGKDDAIIGITYQKNPPMRGNIAIGQIVQNTVAVKYNFTKDGLVPKVSFLPEIDSYASALYINRTLT